MQPLGGSCRAHDRLIFRGRLFAVLVLCAHSLHTQLGSAHAAVIAAGRGHSLALTSAGTVVGWGSNFNGEANGAAAGGNNVAIDAGYGQSLALKSNGTVVGWGNNEDGQANGWRAGINNVAIVAGDSYSLALKSDGTVAGWGPNRADDGAAGINNVAIAAGASHSLALKSNGTVVGWQNYGLNDDGESYGAAAGGNNVAIAAGESHSLALKSNGAVVGWGWNEYGQANGGIAGSNNVAVAAGRSHSLAVKSNGAVIGWGDNEYGQASVPGGLFLPVLADWTTPWGGNFLGSHNWRYGTPSTAASDARFALNANYTVTFNANARARNIHISSGAVTFDLNGHTYQSERDMTIDAPAELIVNGGSLQSSQIAVSGVLSASGPASKLSVTDTLTVDRNVWLQDGASMTVDGVTTISSNGHLQISGASTGASEQVTLGVVEVHGQLEVVSGGLLNSGNVTIGQPGFGIVAVSGRSFGGSRSKWVADGTIYVGGDSVGAQGRLSVDNGGLIQSNALIVRKEGVLSLARATVETHLATIIAPTFQLDVGGLLEGSGTINGDAVINGKIQAGNSPGTIKVNGSYMQGAEALLELEIAGLGSDQMDHLIVNGDTALGGTVVFKFDNGFAPRQGDSFGVVTGSGLLEFSAAAFQIQNLAAGFEFNINADGGNLVMTALNDGIFVPEGDYNQDGAVDAADYVVWRKTGGTQPAYDTWRANFGRTAALGATAGPASSAAVPEPAARFCC